MYARRYFLALVLLLVGAPAVAQNICIECKGVGWLACASRKCKDTLVLGAKTDFKHDAIWGEACCRGIQKVVCPKCQNAIAKAEIENELTMRKSWVDRMRKYDEECGTKFSHVETEQWVLHYSIPQWKIGDASLNRVKASLQWAIRLDSVSSLMRAALQSSPGGKCQAFLVATEAEQKRTTLTQQGVARSAQAFNTYGTPQSGAKFTTRPMPPDMTVDDGFHPHVVHNATHIITQATNGFLQEFPSWLDEGMSHWVELQLFEKATTFCFRELAIGKDQWKQNDWRKSLYSAVAQKKDLPFATIITHDMDKLSVQEKAYAWSFVEFLITAQGPKFPTLFAEMKKDKDTKKALQKALGWSTVQFQEEWRKHVLKTYAP